MGWGILVVVDENFHNALVFTNIKQKSQIQGFHPFQVSDGKLVNEVNDIF